METIFSHIIQKRFSRVNEDVATDALAFILQSSDQARTDFLKLLRGIDADLPDLRFRTQQSEGNIRPDMWGLDGPHARVFVENKFWAGLTENQPVSYLRQLSECPQPTILLVVVPAAREQTIWRELSTRMREPGISQSDRDTPSGLAFCATTQLGPILALTSWRKVLSALELEAASDGPAMADVAQLRALCDAADSHAFIPVAAEDMTDQRTPAFILQMNTIVQDAVQLAVTEGVLDINGLRPQGKHAIRWTRLSCHGFDANQARLQLHVLAYNLGNFLRRLALPPSVKQWSLTTPRDKLIKIGAKVVHHARYVTFQLAEVAVPRRLYRAILERIRRFAALSARAAPV